MLCPLLELAYQARKKNAIPDDSECLEENCAWYQAPVHTCAVRDLAVNLECLNVALADIQATMGRR